MAVLLDGVTGTYVQTRVVVVPRLEPVTVPTRHQHTEGRSVVGIQWSPGCVTRTHVLV